MNNSVRSIAWCAGFVAISVAGFWLGLPRPNDEALRGALRGQGDYCVLGGTSQEIAFHVNRRIRCTRIHTGAPCLSAGVYRNGARLDPSSIDELLAGDEIRFTIEAPQGLEARARGELRVEWKNTTQAMIPWTVTVLPSLEVRASSGYPECLKEGANEVDLEWVITKRGSKLGWQQRARVVVETGGRLVTEARVMQGDSVLRLLTRIACARPWGQVSLGRICVEVDGDECSANWSIPLGSPADACPRGGLVQVRTSASDWSTWVRTALPAKLAPESAVAELRILTWACDVEAEIDMRTMELVCRVRDGREGRWHAVVEVTVDDRTWRYALIPEV